MPELSSVATSLPSHRIDLTETKRCVSALVDSTEELVRFGRIADHSRIKERRVVLPLDELLRLKTIEDRQGEYGRYAVALSEDVARRALVRSTVDPSTVGTVISVSCTGYMMPSVETGLIRSLGVNPGARRIPITELGCSAGAAAIGLANDLLKHAPRDESVLIVDVELCSLCLQTVEPATSDVVGAVLFGDAAAAVLLTSGNCGTGPEILATQSVLWAEGMHDLGMRLTTTGLRLQLSRHVPQLLYRRLRPSVDAFLANEGVGISDLSFWIIHPGGPRILEAIGTSLELSDKALRPSWDVWERCGNLSSASVFFILQSLFETFPPREGALGMMLAAGPGLSCEMVLLRAQPTAST